MILRARTSPPTLDFAVPAINIVFLLLLFFITNGSQVNRAELSVTPPTVETLPGDRLPRPLLAVATDGSLHLDGVLVLEPDLVSALSKGGAAASDLNILAERTMPARDLLALMARLRVQTGRSMTLVTRREEARQTP
ncbi:hypothetical protein ASG43_17905 [Aureimonas sp. Leaf454]|uniref:ExbD/TolR family protein n=1 Tax=Aureimonas sp. Leaf454 TaxID=1736381 RepID=UPI0006F4C419|nr:biopolymer transporter ExbD [Aureimonas sp. Leaf454]KQT53708.1 hypothetical protein ASG43_17905 [Aureimonas sp. Leaf454]